MKFSRAEDILQGLSHEAGHLALALALAWEAQPKTTLYKILAPLDLKNAAGKAYQAGELTAMVQELKQKKLLDTPKPRLLKGRYPAEFLVLKHEIRVPLYEHLLNRYTAGQLTGALYPAVGYIHRSIYSWGLHDLASSLGVLRLMLATAENADTFHASLDLFASHNGFYYEYLALLGLDPWDPLLVERMLPAIRNNFLHQALTQQVNLYTNPNRPLLDYIHQQLQTVPQNLDENVRLTMVENLLQQGQWQAIKPWLEGLEKAPVTAHYCQYFEGSVLTLQGQFDKAIPLFEEALKQGRKFTGLKRNLLPHSSAWHYPLALMASNDQAQLEKALKYCLAESRKRKPEPSSYWGLWVHVLEVRLGLKENQFDLSETLSDEVHLGDVTFLLACAWLGPQTLGLTPARIKTLQPKIDAYRRQLRDSGRQALLDWLNAAWDRLQDKPVPDWFFTAAQPEPWRQTLEMLRSLAEPQEQTPSRSTRLIWTLRIDADGALKGIKPLQQTHGKRGWNKPRAISFNQLMKAADLAPWDLKLLASIRPDRYDKRYFSIDLASAIAALVGHPAVALEDQPEQLLELVEGQPELELKAQRGGFVLRINPKPRGLEHLSHYSYLSNAEQDSLRDLCFTTLVQDSPSRLRLIRFSPAQQRIAQVLGESLKLPEQAKEPLQELMHSFAGQFQVQGEAVQASREVTAESRLRAELSPVGEDLLLRLVAAPLGPDGPRLPPGQGRKQLIGRIGEETLGCQRDLKAEQQHLNQLLDALPFLVDPQLQGGCEWLLDDPEQALGTLELLPQLDGLAGLDWPKGKPVQVIPLEGSAVKLQVKSQQDWFNLQGEAELDEGLVVSFELLLQAGRSGSRFIPLGEGRYAALSRRLKERLSELAGVVESQKNQLQVPRLALPWLQEQLDGLNAQFDKGFRQSLEQLQQAQDLQPKLPKALQAELRPYQEDGYQWAMRLAAAGFGGCLADDMGLGKTLQALAVLLARAADGPALVVAPTSVCGNWLAECARFAPNLNASLYSEADRESLIAEAGPMDLIIVSYGLLQQAGDRFASRRWHSLICDEAQAFKNAAAKRAQAIFELEADFRLALSGTPVENRLAELWSIMRFANPGLLGSLPRFNQRFANPIERDQDRNAQHILRRLIAPFVLRRTKTQVLQELPARTELVMDIELPQAEAAHYEALRRQALVDIEQSMKEGGPGSARFHILAQLTRLRRAACDPRLVNERFASQGAKLQAFAELAAELVANGHKALVFSQFVDFLQILRQPLDEAAISYQYLDGSTPATERTRRVNAFQAGEADLFLISLKAGGFGLNLTAADYVVITDPWWNPAAEDQAMGRAHRMGQQRPVTVYRLVSQGTIEERIIQLHHAKRALAEGVLSGEESTALPSTDDLMELMRGGE
ncbi:DEAD/DEAH box helicase [Magnetovirga frankeli]|uniref:DEAD/DEAH box helicase n=1 Tax=Magnetovirga frankeli TaxID=947516 RepID=UPI003D335CDF